MHCTGVQVEDCRQLGGGPGGGLTVLLAGTESGQLHLLVGGFLPCVRLEAARLAGAGAGAVQSVSLASDLATLSLLVGEGEAACLLVLHCPLLASCRPELSSLASQHCMLHGLLQYSSQTLAQVQEAWETILLELDTKLAHYAGSSPPGTVSADFLELLMFGVASPQLHQFLTVQMTEKGLKKLGTSLELSYSNTQRLVVKYLGAVCQSFTFQVKQRTRRSNK